jgi:hypothetical protein
MNVEIAHRRGSATHFFQRAEPFGCRLLQRIVIAAFAQNRFNHGLEAARAGTNIVHWIDTRIGRALLEIAAQRCGELLQMLRMAIRLARSGTSDWCSC